MQKLNKTLNSIINIQLILGMLLALLPNFISPVCGPMPNGKYMACHYTGYMITAVGILLIVVAIAAIILPRTQKIYHYGIGLVQIISTALCYLIGTRTLRIPYEITAAKTRYIGLCGKLEHPCHATFDKVERTILFVVILAIAYLVLLYLYRPEQDFKSANKSK